MTFVFCLISAVFAAVLAGVLCRVTKGTCRGWLSAGLCFVLPFAAGGFHTYLFPPVFALILFVLLGRIRKKGALHLYWNLPSIAIFLLTAGYLLSLFWAKDRGMAPFAIVRIAPVFLFALYRMQEGEEPQEFLNWIPICGTAMVILSFALAAVPGIGPYVTVNGRLAGFFQYPNTFSVFLLAGLIICGTRETPGKPDFLCSGILIAGIFLSGSKTGFVLLLVVLVLLNILSKSRRTVLFHAALLLLGAAVSFLCARAGILNHADRFSSVSASSGTFLVRLLYYKDILPVIGTHPLGIGYLGYPALEGAIQTGRYYVRYVHNGLLQTLLEAGWLPGLTLAAAFVTALCSKNTDRTCRLILIFCLAHCMLDFDLQYLSIWILLLTCLDFRKGRCFQIKSANWVKWPGSLVLLLCLWLGSGEWLYAIGNPARCLAVTPFHTEAWTNLLSQCEIAQEAETIAVKIQALQPDHSLAASARANAAFARGDILSMVSHKEHAIRNAKYTTEEYCDYFDKLYFAYTRYLQAGDSPSAAYCREKLLQIPDLMSAVTEGTDPLAYLTGDDSSLQLPPVYLQQLALLQTS